MVEFVSFYRLSRTRNHFFYLKSDVPKINTNLMQLFHQIEKKIYLYFKVNLKFKSNFLNGVGILSKIVTVTCLIIKYTQQLLFSSGLLPTNLLFN